MRTTVAKVLSEVFGSMGALFGSMGVVLRDAMEVEKVEKDRDIHSAFALLFVPLLRPLR